MKKNNSIITLILVILLISTNVHAIDNFNISASIGFDGKIKIGYLNPVKVNIKSNSVSFDGILNIETETRRYSEHIHIQENTEMDFYFAIPFSLKDREIRVSLEEDENTISTKVFPIEKFHKNSLLIGILNDEPEKLKYLNESTFTSLKEVNFETIDLREHLQMSHDELEAIDYIVLENYTTETLPAEFTDNLIKWISEGHSIFVGTDKYTHKTITGIFSNLDNDKTLSVGYGNIIPIKAGIESKYFSEELEKYSKYLNYKGLNERRNILNEIDNSKMLFTLDDLILKPEYSFLYFFLSLIIIYIILIGIYTNREKGKVFGIIILSFSTVFILISFLTNTVDSSIGQLGIDEYSQGLNSYTITYAKTSKDNMKIGLKGDYIDNYNEEHSKINPISKVISTIEQGDYHIYSRSFKELDDIGLSLNIDNNDILTGEITNPLSSNLDNSFLIIGDTIINIGTLKGKEKVNIEYKLDYNLKNQGDFNYLSEIYNLTDLSEEQRQLFEYYYFNIDNTPYNCKLVGFSRGKDEIQLDGKTKKTKKYTLNIFDLKIQGEFANIPLGTIKPVAFYSGIVDGEIKREWSIEDNQELIVLYPLPTDISVEDIEVNTKVDFGTAKLYVLNRDTNSWEALTSQAFQGELLNKYISNGQIAIKIVGNSRITIPQISVKGKYK